MYICFEKNFGGDNMSKILSLAYDIIENPDKANNICINMDKDNLNDLYYTVKKFYDLYTDNIDYKYRIDNVLNTISYYIRISEEYASL